MILIIVAIVICYLNFLIAGISYGTDNDIKQALKYLCFGTFIFLSDIIKEFKK